MKRVMIESPFAGDVAANSRYARACMMDSLARGEAPLAGHLLWTQVLHDARADERAQGLDCCLSWLFAAELVAVYTDRGVSPGMARAIEAAISTGMPVVWRRLEEGARHDA